jgi:hypothetical protein
MGQAELLIAGLLVAVAGLGALARHLSVPYPIVLVIGGALFGFVPGLPEVKLNRPVPDPDDRPAPGSASAARGSAVASRDGLERDAPADPLNPGVAL